MMFLDKIKHILKNETMKSSHFNEKHVQLKNITPLNLPLLQNRLNF
jgi:hypothetical protein